MLLGEEQESEREEKEREKGRRNEGGGHPPLCDSFQLEPWPRSFNSEASSRGE